MKGVNFLDTNSHLVYAVTDISTHMCYKEDDIKIVRLKTEGKTTILKELQFTLEYFTYLIRIKKILPIN